MKRVFYNATSMHIKVNSMITNTHIDWFPKPLQTDWTTTFEYLPKKEVTPKLVIDSDMTYYIHSPLGVLFPCYFSRVLGKPVGIDNIIHLDPNWLKMFTRNYITGDTRYELAPPVPQPFKQEYYLFNNLNESYWSNYLKQYEVQLGSVNSMNSQCQYIFRGIFKAFFRADRMQAEEFQKYKRDPRSGPVPGVGESNYKAEFNYGYDWEYARLELYPPAAKWDILNQKDYVTTKEPALGKTRIIGTVYPGDIKFNFPPTLFPEYKEIMELGCRLILNGRYWTLWQEWQPAYDVAHWKKNSYGYGDYELSFILGRKSKIEEFEIISARIAPQTLSNVGNQYEGEYTSDMIPAPYNLYKYWEEKNGTN